MDLDEAIMGRRSIRKFCDTPVPEEMVRDIIKAATFAPSAKNGQQWRFTVVTGGAKKELINEFRHALEKLSTKIGRENMGSSLGSCTIMEQAPVVIIVWNAGEHGWETEIHSVAAAIQNMLLKAYQLKLGSLWIGDIFYTPDVFKTYFDNPWRLTAAVALGWPDHTPPCPPRKGVDAVTEFYL